jgi:hypothetical protein
MLTFPSAPTEMSGISDGVTIGIVLLLLFGALFFYIWLRVQQIEKRALLLENILLDLKLHTESTFGDFPAVPAPTHVTASDESSAGASSLDYLADVMPHIARGASVEAEVEVEQDSEMPDYSSALDEIHEAASPKETPSVVAAMMPVASPVEAGSKLGSNYESMTIKELRALAKTRKVQGVSSLSRAQIIQQLKEKDSGAAGAAIWGTTVIKEEDESVAQEIDGALDSNAEGAATIDA